MLDTNIQKLNCTRPRQTDRLTVAGWQRLERVQNICRLITSTGIHELMYIALLFTQCQWKPEELGEYFLEG